MAKDFFQGRVQLLHDTEEHWQQVADTFIPLPGEACVTLDEENKGRVKYGDGIHTWGELLYSNDRNYDNKTLLSKNHVIQIKGYEEAKDGQVPSKSSDGLDWFTPVKAVVIGNDTEHPIIPTNAGRVIIPIAGDNLGVVKASNEIGVNESGEMSVKTISATKIIYKDDETIEDELNKRTTWEEFK